MKSFYIVPTLYFLGNFYLYKWGTRLTRPSPKIRKTALLSLLFVLALLPVGKIWGRHDFNSFNQLLTLFSAVWMGLSLMVILLAASTDCLRFLYGRTRPSAGMKKADAMPLSDSPSPDCPAALVAEGPPVAAGNGEVVLSRRRLLALGVMMGGATLGGCAFVEARNIEVTRLKIPLRGFPARMDGFSVLQISDVHYGMLYESGRLSNIVKQVNALEPDLIVITGDLVDEAVSHMEEMEGPLSKLRSRLGVIAAMGNHEFFSGVDRADAIMRRAGIRVLRNEMTVLPEGLQVLGIDDPTGHQRMGLPKPDFQGLISRLDPEKPSIFLYHQPILFDEVAASGVGLQLSGHTHGPQFFPMVPLVRLMYPRYRGLYREEESFLYVSRGVGTGGPPMRLGSPPELVYIQLNSPRT